MTVTLKLAPETERKLLQIAAASGQDVGAYVHQLIERDLKEKTQRGMRFDEILAPVRRGFEESGMTPEELDQMFEQAREEAWQEKQKKGSP